jgi:hypothetical protein
MYLLAPAIAILGAVPFTLRYVAAMVAILTLAALLRLGRTLLGQSGALWAALALGVLYWHVHNSHVALRALLFPLIGMLAVDGLLRAYHKNRWRDWLVAGFFTGLLAYTYTAAHGWIALILGLCGLWAVFDSQRRKGTMGLIFMAIFMGLPVWIAIQTNPLSDGGLNRTLINSWDELIFNIQNWLQAWTNYSDLNPNNNYPAHPILDAPLAFLAGIGLISVWFVVRKKWYSVLLIAIFIVSLLPSLITLRTPQYIRALGVVVPLALVIGAGAVGTEKSVLALQRFSKSAGQQKANSEKRSALSTQQLQGADSLHREGNFSPPLYEVEWGLGGEDTIKRGLAGEDKNTWDLADQVKLRARYISPLQRRFVLFLVDCLLIALLLSSATHTWRTFDRWLAEYRLVLWIDDRINAAMAFIEKNTPPDMPIYIAELDFHPVAEFHAYHLQRDLRYFAFSDVEMPCFVMPREAAVYLDLPIVVNQLARRMADYGTVTPLYQQPENEYHILHFTPREDGLLDWQQAAFIGDSLAVQAVQPITENVKAGDTLTIYLGMRLQQPLPQHYTWFVHLQNIPTPYDGGIQHSAGDAPLCAAALETRRTPDETLIQTLHLPIPADLTAGDYHVAIGLYDPLTGTRLPINSPDGETRFFRVVDVEIK